MKIGDSSPVTGETDPAPELPKLVLELPLVVSQVFITEAFTQACQQEGFVIIDKQPQQFTAVYKARSVPFWFCFVPRQASISAVKLTMSLTKAGGKRAITVKGIYGSEPVIQQLLGTFDKCVASVTQELPSSLDLAYQESYEEDVITCKHESSSFYQIYKLLSSEQYSAGLSIAEFLHEFEETYANPAPATQQLPQAMHKVKDRVQVLAHSLESHYNCGTSNLAMYCRPAVEKFVFTKLYKPLYRLYKARTSQADEEFSRRRDSLRLSDRELMEALEITEKFRLGVTGAYREAISVLNVVENYRCPLDKMNCLLTMVGAMRSNVVDYWKSKQELISMDDELPVMMFIMLKSSVKRPFAQIALLRDYMGNQYENELRILINCETSLEFIIKELSV